MHCIIYTGIEVETSDGLCKCHAVLLLCSIDLPAQAKLLNMEFFNGNMLVPIARKREYPDHPVQGLEIGLTEESLV